MFYMIHIIIIAGKLIRFPAYFLNTKCVLNLNSESEYWFFVQVVIYCCCWSGFPKQEVKMKEVTGNLQIKNGKYYVIVNLYDHNGKRSIKWVSLGLDSKGNKKAAKSLTSELDTIKKNIEALNQDSSDVEKFIRRLKSFENAEVLTREMCNELIEYVKVDRYIEPNEPRDIYIHYKLLDAPMNNNNNFYKWFNEEALPYGGLTLVWSGISIKRNMFVFNMIFYGIFNKFICMALLIVLIFIFFSQNCLKFNWYML